MKTELNTLFFSPIAWLILIIFTFQAGMAFCNAFGEVIRYQSLGYSPYNITSSLFFNYNGVFTEMLDNLYLYIPLLTMGLMSRELSSGSIKLLYSSPCTNRQIIFGKYLSMVVYAFILIVILSVYVLFTIFSIKNIDFPFVLSGLLGVFLVTCAYAAIGLFMSCLTSYQVVAAVGTLAVLAVLNFIGGIGQDINFVREITYWLAISGRSSTFQLGLICSQDVLYFLIVIALFITLSILKLQAERVKRSSAMIVARYSFVVVIALFMGYLSSRPTLMCFYDTTETKQNTLTVNSQEVVKKLKGDLKVTTYVNILENNYWRAMPNHRMSDMEQLEKYVRFKPEMEVDYVYYYDKAHNPSLDQRYPGLSDKERAQEMCKVMDWDIEDFLTPEEIKKVIDLSGEGNRLVRIFEWNGQKSILRFYEDTQRYPSESETTAALKRFVSKAPKVGFLVNHGERNINGAGERDYGAFVIDLTFRYALPNQGFDITPLSLNDTDVIPEDIDIIVIAELKQALSETEMAKLNAYIAKGGNLIIAGEPRRQEIMNPLVESLGVQFMPGILVQPTKDFVADLVMGNVTKDAAELSKGYSRLLKQNRKIVTPGAVGLKYTEDKGFKVHPLVVTDEKGVWNELETTDFIENEPTYDPTIGEEERAIPIMLELTRQVGDKEQRILIWGDADCISNGELGTSRDKIKSSNFSVITESFGALAYNEFPVDTSRQRPSDDESYIGEGSEIWMKIGFMGVFPGLLVFMYILLWWRRRGR